MLLYYVAVQGNYDVHTIQGICMLCRCTHLQERHTYTGCPSGKGLCMHALLLIMLYKILFCGGITISPVMAV